MPTITYDQLSKLPGISHRLAEQKFDPKILPEAAALAAIVRELYDADTPSGRNKKYPEEA